MSTLYCYVQDNIISTPEQLPTMWRVPTTGAILNLSVYTPQELNEFGWYKYFSLGEPDTTNAVLISSVKQLSGDCVVESFITRPYTQEELDYISTTQYNDLWLDVRIKRNDLLDESDIFVVADKWEVMSSEEKQSWMTYREALRNIPQNFSTPLDIVWPQSPAGSDDDN